MKDYEDDEAGKLPSDLKRGVLSEDLVYDLIREDGLAWWTAQKAYWGVRLFGGGAWHEEP